MSRITNLTISIATALMLLHSITADAVLNMGSKTIFTGTLIEVLEPGPDLQAIIDNITDATASKPYLIRLGAGVYDLGSTQIVMKEYISVTGSGQNATIIASAVIGVDGHATGAVVVSKDNVSLTDITIKNAGGGAYSMAVYNGSVSPRIERITVDVTGGSLANMGIKNVTSAPIMTNIIATAYGNMDNRGVVNDAASPTMNNVTASASGGTGSNIGVLNKVSSAPTMINVIASASGGTNSRGVANNASSPTMISVTASASGGTVDSFGMNSHSVSSPFIQDSILEGDTYSMYINSDSPGTRLVNSKLVGSVWDGAAGSQCRGNYNSNLAAVNC